MDNNIAYLKATRENIIKAVNDFSIEQLNAIPEVFHNNLAWNLGHVLVTQQLLCYRMSGNKGYVADEMINRYRKGTKPEMYIPAEEIAWIKEQLIKTTDLMQEDYKKGILSQYKPYATSYGVELKSIEDAMAFNLIHEGMHFGYMLGLRKSV